MDILRSGNVKTAIWNRILLASTVIFFGACSSSGPTVTAATSTPAQLFTLEPTPTRKGLLETASGNLATLLADPANVEFTLVKINPALISQQTQDLAVSLPDGKTAQFHLRDFTTITPGIDGWVGYKPSAWKAAHAASASEIENDPLYYLSLAREGDNLVGRVVVEGQRYRLDSIGSGQYVLIKVDESKLPAEGEPRVDPAGQARDDTQGKVPLSAHSTIRVMFLATYQRRAKSPLYRLELAQALNDANQYMKNSDVQITYELAGFFDEFYDETGRDYSQQLNDIRLAQPFAGNVLRRREVLGADMVSMYSAAPGLCGQAWLTSSKEQAHSVISCTDSLAHELGHNLGANHNWKEGDNEGRPPYMYGYLYNRLAPRFSTQMSAKCSPTSACPRLAYHSNPRLAYYGVLLGTEAHHDVARRFNERRETVENFYPVPLAPPMDLEFYPEKNFSGHPCSLEFLPNDIRPNCNKVHSVKVNNFKAGMRLCFYAIAFNYACYRGSYTGDFQVADLDASGTLPDGLGRETPPGDKPLIGRIRNIEYTLDTSVTIQLYSLADYRGDTCTFRLSQGSVDKISDFPGCDAVASGKSRSAKVYAFPGGNSKLCFLNTDDRRSLCFTGSYQGNFQIRNWDVGSDLPQGLVRTHAGGGYMNGSVHRVSFGMQ
ncbi:peptidase M72 family protein [Pseudomonas sp. NY5710]|nr:peptidase M72 family protein [Pseudomonas sp. NY5710]